MIARETKSEVIHIRARPSLAARAEAVAAQEGKSLSEYAREALEAAVARAERQARRQQP